MDMEIILQFPVTSKKLLFFFYILYIFLNDYLKRLHSQSLQKVYVGV